VVDEQRFGSSWLMWTPSRRRRIVADGRQPDDLLGFSGVGQGQRAGDGAAKHSD